MSTNSPPLKLILGKIGCYKWLKPFTLNVFQRLYKFISVQFSRFGTVLPSSLLIRAIQK